jgi:hypothetical protein
VRKRAPLIAIAGFMAIGLSVSGCGSIHGGTPVAGRSTTSEPTVKATRPVAKPAPPDQRKLDWADVDTSEGMCLVFLKGLTPRQALAELVDKPATPVTDPASARRWVAADPGPGDMSQGYRAVALAGTSHGWTWTLEPNGYFCSVDPPIRRLSRHGDYVSVYWNVELDNAFTLARRGTVVRQFDMVLYREAWNEVGPALPEELNLDWDAFASASLCLQSRLTGEPARDDNWLEDHADVALGYVG